MDNTGFQNGVDDVTSTIGAGARSDDVTVDLELTQRSLEAETSFDRLLSGRACTRNDTVCAINQENFLNNIQLPYSILQCKRPCKS